MKLDLIIMLIRHAEDTFEASTAGRQLASCLVQRTPLKRVPGAGSLQFKSISRCVCFGHVFKRLEEKEVPR
jgi:hypothetical protein